MPTSPPTTGTQSIDRAADLVARVVRADGDLTATALAEATGLARSTTSRLLAALERADLLARDDAGAWAPGPLFDLYAIRRGDDEVLAEVAGPTMRELGELTGETVNLGVPRRGTVVQIAQVDAAYYLGSRDWVGTDVPAHASALGKVLYAHGALPVPTGPLDPPAAAAVTSGARLAEQLPGIRRAGYATTVDELEPGLTGVAAPVRSHGTVVAALGISGPTSRLADGLAATGALVATHAAALSARLDHPHEGAA
ncbi:MAG: IclR family transcriptional regulator [Micrococcales bacterium]|uniref:IclR family transcriptional regulator n=1 Tax=Phycicoccus sp. TaxID=1902410 RepID=UPI00199C4D7E|nr:IclR family transcriptional regulator [Phycicoccus sp.]MBD3781669.1 IclR family transcriptional regulator [Micrococcales bacterium]HMM94160.1 IclR family transcriptional regulator [Phycicoccus sp.]